jgi:hypothetical protein
MRMMKKSKPVELVLGALLFVVAVLGLGLFGGVFRANIILFMVAWVLMLAGRDRQ